VKILTGLFYSFPVQLVLVHIKKHHFLLLIWVFLTLLVTSTVGRHYGMNYLYLDPEYLGEVDFLSFFFIGLALGGFTVTWNITAYILHAHRFPFLATLYRPFGVFMLNNSLIPLAFLAVYITQLVAFQRDDEFASTQMVLSNVLGLLTGVVLMVFLSGTYFFQTNKDIWQILGLKRESESMDIQMVQGESSPLPALLIWRVDTYLNIFLRSRIVRSVAHYDVALLQKVYGQHHGNAVFIEITGLVLLLALGLLIDYDVFRIPAGASMLLLFGLLVALTGAFSYWIRGWRAAMYLALILALNALMQQDLFKYQNHAYGLNYNGEPAEYSLHRLDSLSHPARCARDRAHWQSILNNWAANNPPQRGRKPYLVLINASGGGLRAGLFATRVLQQADSLCGGRLMNQAFLITGASGGMLGSAYYRQIAWLARTDTSINKYGSEHLEAMGADILNPVLFAGVVNDLFLPWQQFQVAGQDYRKDRAYVFERTLHKNTGGVLDIPLCSLREPEIRQEMPLMVISPTVINDGRKLYISPQPVSWLSVPDNRFSSLRQRQVDGTDFGSFFREQGADSLRFSSALRMNATFPYILPNVALPASPVIEVMDAGLRDNFGLETSTRFINTFADWLRNNTGGVVIVEIRGHEQFETIADYRGQSFLERLFSPVGNILSNWSEIQDYQHDFLIDYASEQLDGKLDVLVFEYTPMQGAHKASVSLHLTKREKADILQALASPHNQGEFQRLRSMGIGLGR
jgi:hypothetical protein